MFVIEDPLDTEIRKLGSDAALSLVEIRPKFDVSHVLKSSNTLGLKRENGSL